MNDPVEILASVVAQAKAWQKADRPLTSVRNISESNEATLNRVCKDYREVEDILNEHLSYKEHNQLRDRWTGYLPILLRGLFTKYKDMDTKLKEENAQLRAKLASTRAHLTTIGEWDCLNPPQTKLLSDLPWLRKVVDDALASIGSADT